MKKRSIFSVTIAATSPLALGTESSLGNFEQTANSISGSALRGAAARRALQDCTQPDFLTAHKPHSQCPDKEQCPYWKLFGAGEVWFGNAYPGQFPPVLPLPLTARTCKYYPGIPEPEKTSILEKPKHGVFDTLIEQFTYELLSDPVFPMRSELAPELADKFQPMPRKYEDKCPVCHEPTRPAPGFFTSGATPVAAGSLPVRRQVHVGINRARFAAEDSLLYTQEIADPAGTRTNFYGRVTADEDQAECLQAVMNGQHYLGRGRSRGYGEVYIQLGELPAEDPLASRIEQFNQEIQRSLSAWRAVNRIFPERLSGKLFSVTLLSPAILEEFGRPHLLITPEMLGLPDTRLLRAWTRPITVSGWDSAAQLPRRTRQAACAGSVYLFWTPALETVLPTLERLEQEGLGAERSRGCGQIHVCSPFHYQAIRH